MPYARAAIELTLHIVAWGCFLTLLALLFTA
jgi:hypothetical protein